MINEGIKSNSALAPLSPVLGGEGLRILFPGLRGVGLQMLHP